MNKQISRRQLLALGAGAVTSAAAAIGAVIRRRQNSRDQDSALLQVLQQKSREQQELLIQTIATIANAMEAKDEYTDGHSRRVAEYSEKLALELGKSPEQARRIYHIALLHDIGKIGIPDALLSKPDKLTEEETKVFRRHPVIGSNILKDLTFFPGLALGALYHHERYDGTGYPEGLKGEEIPEEARIISVADAVDAMNSDRVYHKSCTLEHIRHELETCQGTQFDPEAAAAMLRLIDQGRLWEGKDQPWT